MATKKRATKKRATKKRATKQSDKVDGLKVRSSLESGQGDIGLEYILPPDVPVFYVDNINVLHTPSEFTISFMQAQPPLLKNAAEWKEVKAIPSKCVVRLIISPMKMELVVKALARNYQSYVQTYFEPEAGDANENTKTDGDTGTPRT